MKGAEPLVQPARAHKVLVALPVLQNPGQWSIVRERGIKAN
jgi:hypothetical protein